MSFFLSSWKFPPTSSPSLIFGCWAIVFMVYKNHKPYKAWFMTIVFRRALLSWITATINFNGSTKIFPYSCCIAIVGQLEALLHVSLLRDRISIFPTDRNLQDLRKRTTFLWILGNSPKCKLFCMLHHTPHILKL